MAYCHKCGKQAREEDGFCGHCGAHLKEFVENIEHDLQRTVKKSRKGLFFLIIFLIIIGYVVLDIWAMTQLRPVLSLDSLASSVSNFGGSAGLTSAQASTTIRIENPTFVPVIAGRVVYDAGYGTTKAIQGKTGMVIVGPYSDQDLPADVQVSYIGAGVSGLKALKDWLFGGKDKWNANAYMDIGITKFQIGKWEK